MQVSDAVCKAICGEIMDIMATYREQDDQGRIDSPGGLEHMGDVWRMLRRWDDALRVAE